MCSLCCLSASDSASHHYLAIVFSCPVTCPASVHQTHHYASHALALSCSVACPTSVHQMHHYVSRTPALSWSVACPAYVHQTYHCEQALTRDLTIILVNVILILQCQDCCCHYVIVVYYTSLILHEHQSLSIYCYVLSSLHKRSRFRVSQSYSVFVTLSVVY